MLFAERVGYATEESYFFDFLTVYNSFLLEGKIEYYNIIFEGVNKIDDTWQINKLIDIYTSLKKKKHKSRKAYKTLKKTEQKVFNRIQGDCEKFAEAYLETNKLDTLKPFISPDYETNVIYLYQWKDCDDEAAEHDLMISSIAGILRDKNTYSFFDDAIEKSAAPALITENLSIDSNLLHEDSFIYYPLFQLPILNELEYNQLKILRTDFKKHVNPLLIELGRFAEKLHGVKYKNIDIKDIFNKLASGDIFNKEATQSFIDNHIYIDLVKNRNEDDAIFSINIGICSYDCFIVVLTI